jgi:hypothetical protein
LLLALHSFLFLLLALLLLPRLLLALSRVLRCLLLLLLLALRPFLLLALLHSFLALLPLQVGTALLFRLALALLAVALELVQLLRCLRLLLFSLLVFLLALHPARALVPGGGIARRGSLRAEAPPGFPREELESPGVQLCSLRAAASAVLAHARARAAR